MSVGNTKYWQLEGVAYELKELPLEVQVNTQIFNFLIRGEKTNLKK